MLYKSKADIERVIELGKQQEVIEKFWHSYQEGLQYQQWLDERQAEYSALTVTEEQVVGQDAEGNDLVEVVVISEPEVSFEEWLQEREIVTEQIAETTFDTEGNEVTVTKMVEREGNILRQFVPDVISSFAESEYHASYTKQRRDKAIKELTVEVNGLVFDADPVARQNMLDAIVAAGTVGQESTTWKMADNSFEVITLEQLKQAQALAIQAVGNVVIQQ